MFSPLSSFRCSGISRHILQISLYINIYYFSDTYLSSFRMNTQSFFHAVLAATCLFLQIVTASPFGVHARFMNLEARDLYVDSTCTKFVYGSTNVEIGTVCVSIMNGKLIVKYTINSDKCSDISVVHVWVGKDTLPDRNPGGFPYSNEKGQCTLSRKTAECIIDVDPSWRTCEGVLKIATHAGLTCASGSQTGWGYGPCFPSSNGNCAKYWTFTTHCQCPVLSVYPQEYSTVCASIL